MKKLFENWRKFEKNILSELDVGPGGGLQTHATAQAKDPELYQKSSKVNAKNELAKALKEVPQAADKIASAEHRVARADAFLFVMILSIAPLWAGKAPKIAFVLTKAANGLRFLLKSVKRNEGFSDVAQILMKVLDLFDDFIAKKYPGLAPGAPKVSAKPGEKIVKSTSDDELVRARDKILNDLRGTKRSGSTRPDLPLSRPDLEKTRSMRAVRGD
jgi:hypothetical protein